MISLSLQRVVRSYAACCPQRTLIRSTSSVIKSNLRRSITACFCTDRSTSAVPAPDVPGGGSPCALPIRVPICVATRLNSPARSMMLRRRNSSSSSRGVRFSVTAPFGPVVLKSGRQPATTHSDLECQIAVGNRQFGQPPPANSRSGTSRVSVAYAVTENCARRSFTMPTSRNASWRCHRRPASTLSLSDRSLAPIGLADNR